MFLPPDTRQFTRASVTKFYISNGCKEHEGEVIKIKHKDVIKEPKDLISKWVERVTIIHICHARLSARYTQWGRRIGLLTTIFSAVVATALFTSFSQSDNTSLLIIAGSFSVIAVIFSASQNFLKFPELAEHHRQAISAYGKLKHDLEIENTYSLTDTEKKKKLKRSLRNYNLDWSKYVKEFPPVPNDLYFEVENERKNNEKNQTNELVEKNCKKDEQ